LSSTFEILVVPVVLEPHPNADTLSIVRIGGYQVVVKTDEYINIDRAAYIPPDVVVPNRPEWAFLDGRRRIKTRKFRGQWSHGLLHPSRADQPIGTNVADELGIVPYEPPSSSREGLSTRAFRALPWYKRFWARWKGYRERPSGHYPHYDVENLRKLPDLFSPGESIIVTEKVHGANALYTSRCSRYNTLLSFFGICSYPRIYIRSRTMWKHPAKRDWWQDAYRATPGLAELLRDFPGISVYGEVYGKGVQGLEYGVTSPHFVAFDIWDRKARVWLTQKAVLYFLHGYGVPIVPILYEGEFINNDMLYMLANDYHKYSVLAAANGSPKQISEGVVVQSLESRKILKIVNDSYLEKAE
jgi:tRNA-binding EMAP/Myf-like protein